MYFIVMKMKEKTNVTIVMSFIGSDIYQDFLLYCCCHHFHFFCPFFWYILTKLVERSLSNLFVRKYMCCNVMCNIARYFECDVLYDFLYEILNLNWIEIGCEMWVDTVNTNKRTLFITKILPKNELGKFTYNI